jgi:hypothetical protein
LIQGCSRKDVARSTIKSGVKITMTPNISR